VTTSTPQAFFESVVYASLPWPWKTAWLERDSVRDVVGRPASGRIAVAELYHENSKLFAETIGELAATRLDAGEVRRAFVRRRASSLTGVAHEAPPRVRELLTYIAKSLEPELFYAVELRVAVGEIVLRHEPVRDALFAHRTLDDRDMRLLEAALAPSRDGGRWQALAFVLGSFARNELLFGARGYRETLLEAGRVLNELIRQAERRRLRTTLLPTFFDRAVDALLEADGIEEGVLAVVELGGVHHDP
jgi:hypothetical protein